MLPFFLLAASLPSATPPPERTATSEGMGAPCFKRKVIEDDPLRCTLVRSPNEGALAVRARRYLTRWADARVWLYSYVSYLMLLSYGERIFFPFFEIIALAALRIYPLTLSSRHPSRALLPFRSSTGGTHGETRG